MTSRTNNSSLLLKAMLRCAVGIKTSGGSWNAVNFLTGDQIFELFLNDLYQSFGEPTTKESRGGMQQ